MARTAERAMMPTSRAGTSNERGFTFVEISMVLFILVLFVLAAFPRFSALLAGRDLERTVSRLAAYIEHLRDQAVYRKSIVVLRCDLGKGECRAIGAGGDDRVEVLMRPLKLPGGVRIDEIVLAGKRKVTEGEAVIPFRPGGRTDGAFIHIRDEGGWEVTLEIPCLARNVKVHEGHLDVI